MRWHFVFLCSGSRLCKNTNLRRLRRVRTRNLMGQPVRADLNRDRAGKLLLFSLLLYNLCVYYQPNDMLFLHLCFALRHISSFSFFSAVDRWFRLHFFAFPRRPSVFIPPCVSFPPNRHHFIAHLIGIYCLVCTFLSREPYFRSTHTHARANWLLKILIK